MRNLGDMSLNKLRLYHAHKSKFEDMRNLGDMSRNKLRLYHAHKSKFEDMRTLDCNWSEIFRIFRNFQKLPLLINVREVAHKMK